MPVPARLSQAPRTRLRPRSLPFARVPTRRNIGETAAQARPRPRAGAARTRAGTYLGKSILFWRAYLTNVEYIGFDSKHPLA